ncbi:MAG: SgcJ/EcaC family oxidoreductase [Alphaproteobacteria bacterium]
MKKILLLLAALTVLAFNNTAWAGKREEVDAAFSEWRAALSSGEAKNVVQLYDEDATLFATLEPKPLTTQRERTRYFTTLTAKPKLSATVNQKKIQILDDEYALVSGIYTFRFEQDGKTVAVPARYTFVYEKEDGRWMILEHHSSKVPQ